MEDDNMKILGYGREQLAWVGVRLILGLILLWAFLDKTFGLGFSTTADRAWLSGGSPTTGYLSGTSGIFSGIYQGLAGNAVVDVLFMLALLAVGIAMILGIGMKIAGYSGAALMLLMWTSIIPPKTNPILDDHVVYAILFFALTTVKAGQWLGLGKWWINTPVVKKFPFLE
jgi:thiosulfate dehydrogenase [quinone] large subunit